jgi:hypothetical protein
MVTDKCQFFDAVEKKYDSLFKSTSSKGVGDLRIFLAQHTTKPEFEMPWVVSGKATVVTVRQYLFDMGDLDFELNNEISAYKAFRNSSHVLNLIDCFTSMSSAEAGFDPNLPKDVKYGLPTVYLLFEKSKGNFAKSENKASPYAILKSMELKDRLRVYQKIAEAVASLHRNNQVYGNLEESTIVAMDDSLSTIKLSDFEFMNNNKVAIPLPNKKYAILTTNDDVKAFGYLVTFFEDYDIRMLTDSTTEVTKAEFKLDSSKNKYINKSLMSLVEKCISVDSSTFSMNSVVQELRSIRTNASSKSGVQANLTFNYSSKQVVKYQRKKEQRLADLVPKRNADSAPRRNQEASKIAMNFRGYMRTTPKYYNLLVKDNHEVMQGQYDIRKTRIDQQMVDPAVEAMNQALFDQEARNVRLSQLLPDDGKMPQRMGRVVLGGEYERTETKESHFSIYVSVFGVILAGLVIVPIVYLCNKRQY